ncbi:MAG: exonuclease SbcCD subunit D [Candidatus Hodarchaeota archaeon]
MNITSIKFLHIADTHFGVHYALKPRNMLRRAYGDLFFQKAEETLTEAITTHKVDFILHVGDFFNRSKPPKEVVDRAVKPFINAAVNLGVPIYILPGNHERSKLPLGLLSYYDNIHIFTNPSSFIFERNEIFIKITGFPYIRHESRLKFNKTVNQAWKNTINENKQPHYSILATHQLIEGSCVEHYTFKKSGHNVIPFDQIVSNEKLPKFNYIACGHVHRFQFLYHDSSSNIISTNEHISVLQDLEKKSWKFDNEYHKEYQQKEPVVCYSGSLERVSMAERNEPKGYIIADLNFSEKNHRTSFKFHRLSSILMYYLVWDLNQNSMDEWVDRTLNTLYTDINVPTKSPLRAVFRIKVKGRYDQKAVNLDFLKQEAKRLNVYLTFTFRLL